MEKRIVDLEEKITYQDRIIDDLNQVIIELQRRVDICEKELTQLKNWVKNATPIVKKLEDEEPPPHY